MARHESWELKQMQAVPLQGKITMTKVRIRQWYDYWDGNVYVSFSGGKDSTVLKHIVDSMYDDVPAVFVNTSLEYPEIQQFVRDVIAHKYQHFNPDVVMLRPELRFDEVIKMYGYPVISKEVSQRVHDANSAKRNGRKNSYTTKFFNGTALTPDGKKSPYNIEKWKFLLQADFDISNKCCDVMKKKPMQRYEKHSGRKPIIATMASESRLRYTKWIQNGCNAFNVKRPSSQPMSFWTEQDVLHYIKEFNVPYASVYRKIVPVGEYDKTKLKTTGCDRTGCIFCMFGCHLEKEPNRFQRLKETHPRQYEYCIGGGEYVDGKWQPSESGLGIGRVLDYIGVDYK